jgi:hypothetical protein
MAVVINDLEPQTLFEIFRSEPSKGVEVDPVPAQLALVVTPGCYQQKSAKMATCQKLWRIIAADDSLWQVWCNSDFLLQQTVAPTGHPQDTWRCACASRTVWLKAALLALPFN